MVASRVFETALDMVLDMSAIMYTLSEVERELDRDHGSSSSASSMHGPSGKPGKCLVVLFSAFQCFFGLS